MTWQSVGRKDFRDSLRSRWLWVLTAVFVVVFSLTPLLVLLQNTGMVGGHPGKTTDQYVSVMEQATSILVPLISIVIGYAAITRERESGTLKLILSLPHSREDMVFGKVFGRSGVVGVSIVLGFVVAAIILLATTLQFKLVNYLLFALLTLLLALVFVGLSVGISGAVKTSRRAMVVSVAVYLIFLVFWNGLANAVTRQFGKYAGLGYPGKVHAILLVRLFNPMTAYKTLVNGLILSSQFNARVMLFGLWSRQGVANVLGKPLPFYLSDAAVIIYLLFWLFVPVAIGYSVFSRADL